MSKTFLFILFIEQGCSDVPLDARNTPSKFKNKKALHYLSQKREKDTGNASAK
ncbi:hypothetical protein [Pseudomonas sp. 18175]|uniref:hypothetical protein n=1 Tax=Pseudomonas sp. 18175 TaxID=3390056 RepID=UPI003D1982B0